MSPPHPVFLFLFRFHILRELCFEGVLKIPGERVAETVHVTVKRAALLSRWLHRSNEIGEKEIPPEERVNKMLLNEVDHYFFPKR